MYPLLSRFVVPSAKRRSKVGFTHTNRLHDASEIICRRLDGDRALNDPALRPQPAPVVVA
jgi:hypothetical protein